MNRYLALLALVAALLAGCGGATKVQLDGTVLTPVTPAPNFALRDDNGKTFTLAAQRGRWTVVTFLYTHCPDVCPLIAAHLNAALQSAEGRKAGLHVLAVSVDPKRDTAAAVRTYVVEHRLVSTFHWLIGSRAQLSRVWHAYNVAATPGPKGTITHSTYEMLIDPQGRERVIYDSTMTTDQLLHDLRALS